MKRRLILLDLDDTLIYQERVNRDILLSMAEDIFPQNAELFTKTFASVARQLWEELPTFPWTRKIGISWGEGLWGEFQGRDENLQRLARLSANYRVVVWQETLDRLGRPLASAQAQAYAEKFAARRRQSIVWLEGAKSLLDWLRPRFHLGLLTNGAPDLQRFKIRAAGLEGWFDSITVSGEHGIGKPAAAIFRIAQAGFPPDTPCLMIGNSPSSDIQGATNAGLPSIWLDIKETTLPAHLHPIAIVEQLDQVPELLEKFGWLDDAPVA